MNTPFDRVVDEIKRSGFHNHRRPLHSDSVSLGILDDLSRTCRPFFDDLTAGVTKKWLNVRTPGARHRKIDLLVGCPAEKGKPDLSRLRLCIENKSVITAHRNATTRFDDLNETLHVLHKAQSEAILIATVIIGVARRFLNISDHVKKHFRKKPRRFESHVLSRLSSGDESLWNEFDFAISENAAEDPLRTVSKFRQLPTRPIGYTHIVGYDYVLLVPVCIDNVNRPFVARENTLGIDVDAEYQNMLDRVCKAYDVRWHS